MFEFTSWCLLHISNVLCSSTGRPFVSAVLYGAFFISLCASAHTYTCQTAYINVWKKYHRISRGNYELRNTNDIHSKNFLNILIMFIPSSCTFCTVHKDAPMIRLTSIVTFKNYTFLCVFPEDG